MQAQSSHKGAELSESQRKRRAQRITNPTRPRLLSLKQAASYLGVREWQMRTLAWNGIVPIVQFPNGRKMYFDIVDLDEVIERNKITN
jgi:hypothetical protein